MAALDTTASPHTQVDTGMHERTVFTKEQAAAWRQYAFDNFHPEPKRPLTECPPPKAVILGRTQGRECIFPMVTRIFVLHPMCGRNV